MERYPRDPRRLPACLLLFTLAVLLDCQACSTCTEGACTGGLEVDLSRAESSLSAGASLLVQAGGEEISCSLGDSGKCSTSVGADAVAKLPASSDAGAGASPQLAAEVKGTTLAIAMAGLAPTCVAVRLSQGATQTQTWTFRVRYARVHPNGEDCAGWCEKTQAVEFVKSCPD